MTTRRLLPTAVALLVAAAVAQVPALAAAHPPATAMKTVSPVTKTGEPAAGYTITHHYTGASCVSGSATTGTSYQCFSARSPEGVFDSCWVRANRDYVTCLANPWTHKATRLHVTAGYNNRWGFSTVSSPWGLRLGASTRCLLDPGEVRTADGHAITYLCSHKIVLTGQPRKSSPTWTISAYRRVPHKHAPTTYTSLGHQAVSVRWRGRPSARG